MLVRRALFIVQPLMDTRYTLSQICQAGKLHCGPDDPMKRRLTMLLLLISNLQRSGLKYPNITTF